jgi:putative NADPH-quinone reductase
MNILVILAHPVAGSFNHAIAGELDSALRELGHSVVLHDLHAEGFDAVMPGTELARDVVLPPEIERHCREVDVADGIVIVHPNWWSAPPAILRGWVDRVLRAGRAYEFVPDGRGGARSVGLLRARAAVVFNTANTPQAKEEELFGDPLEVHWRKVVFGLCGIREVYRRNFSPVILSTPEQRRDWLAEVRHLVGAVFPRVPA